MLTAGVEPARKKFRKGTFSCWECKRRKVRCTFRSETDSACSGCRSRGVECYSQKLVDEDVATSANRSIPDRVGRLETLMETCIQSITEVQKYGARNSHDVPTPESLTITNAHDSAPILSLFNNNILDPSHTNENLNDRDIGSLRSYTKTGTSQSKAESTRQTLLALIPSQSQVEKIANSAGDWWRMWRCVYPEICDLDKCSSLTEFTSQAHSESHVATIANVLLCIAASLQQLPSTFDFSSIQMNCSARDLVEEYTLTVTSLVASDDELTASIEGLECLVLLGKIYLDAGKPRKSWLSFGRAMNVAEIIGLHRNSARSAVGPDGISASRKASVWWQIYQSDRLLSLLLGFSHGISDEFCDLDICDERSETAYIKKVAKLAGRLCDRNQTVSGQSYSVTQELEEKLRIISTQMPQNWWTLPTASIDSDGAVINFRIIAQLWHYQVELLLHLPFMLRSINELKYEHNKYMCLKASRDMIERFLFLKNEQCAIFRTCKMIEFQAFIAAVVLQLNLLGQANIYLSEEPRRLLNDSETVDQVMIELMRHSSNGGSIAPQAVKVLETLKAVTRDNGAIGSRFKLKIPYFGTISIRREAKASDPNTELPSSLKLAPTNALRKSASTNNQSHQFTTSMDDHRSVLRDFPEMPQVSFTSSLFVNPYETLAQWTEDEWSLPDLYTQFENNRIPDLDSTWDWLGEDNYTVI